MKALLFAVCLLLGTAALAADAVTVVVGHQCCAGCANALIAGAKQAAWVDAVTVKGTTAVITPLADQPVEFVSLLDGMAKAGFPAKEVAIAAPITLSIGHLCCGGCVNALKKSLTAEAIPHLDVAGTVIDAKARTATVQPVAGTTLNLTVLLQQMAQGGFSATKIVYQAK